MCISTNVPRAENAKCPALHIFFAIVKLTVSNNIGKPRLSVYGRLVVTVMVAAFTIPNIHGVKTHAVN